MDSWRLDVIEGAAVRRAGVSTSSPLWFVHALGDSSQSFAPLFPTLLERAFDLFAPDLPGSGVSPSASAETSIDSLAGWLAEAIQGRTSAGPVGLVGHSLGAAIAVRTAHLLKDRIAGVFSIEGNLTEADAYLSGLAPTFTTPEAFHDHLLRRVRAMAETSVPTRSHALWRYHASLSAACLSPSGRWGDPRTPRAWTTDSAMNTVPWVYPASTTGPATIRRRPRSTTSRVTTSAIVRSLEVTGPWSRTRNRPLLRLALSSRLFEPGGIERETGESWIMINRTCARCGCGYEWGVHAAFFAERVALTPEQLRATVHGRADDPVWSSDEQLIVGLADELHDGADISDTLWQKLANGLRLPRESYAVSFPE